MFLFFTCRIHRSLISRAQTTATVTDIAQIYSCLRTAQSHNHNSDSQGPSCRLRIEYPLRLALVTDDARGRHLGVFHHAVDLPHLGSAPRLSVEGASIAQCTSRPLLHLERAPQDAPGILWAMGRIEARRVERCRLWWRHGGSARTHT